MTDHEGDPRIVGDRLDIGSDELPEVFRRGDANVDGVVDIADAVTKLGQLFVPGTDPTPCFDAGDSNDDGNWDILDPIYLLAYLFSGGPPPPAPGPSECGADVSPDSLDCDAYDAAY